MVLQERAANCGFLSARHWQEVRRAARIARSEGTTLIVHGVICDGSQDKCSNPQHAGANTKTSTAHDGRGSKPTEPVGACEKPSKQQQRRAQRLKDFNEAKRAGLRWLPLVQILLRRIRAKLRGDVWTERMCAKIALHEKMRGFLCRAMVQNARKHALLLREHASTASDCASEDSTVFGPSSFDDEAADDAEEERQMQEAIAASLATASADTPPDDNGANRAGYHTPPRAPPVKKVGKKTRGGKSSRPLQPANRG